MKAGKRAIADDVILRFPPVMRLVEFVAVRLKVSIAVDLVKQADQPLDGFFNLSSPRPAALSFGRVQHDLSRRHDSHGQYLSGLVGCEVERDFKNRKYARMVGLYVARHRTRLNTVPKPRASLRRGVSPWTRVGGTARLPASVG